ncbi:hypothetical protein [Falsiroseomonas selenitidurans]|uniref:Uncharacterized protein n=1 Tax=Falsiroseomonas selenitidurans TaxID=2716335 RepID=A0ABX1E4B2_9PROT|nr:hypothetical protein [Falsiroseomonas selenitidurans]NKC32024.1 hypothetical protein [Falsiroseomonas selenitidurans]
MSQADVLPGQAEPPARPGRGEGTRNRANPAKPKGEPAEGGSEFLGLHDPWADAPAGTEPAPRPPAGPLVTREKAGELVRAGGALAALFILIAVVITALG